MEYILWTWKCNLSIIIGREIIEGEVIIDLIIN